MLFKQKDTIIVGDDLEIIKSIPKGVWLLTSDESQINYKLEKQPDFKLPETLYGDETDISSRFLDAYKKATKSLGVLLSGTKGAGKTVTAKKTCINSGLPVILVTQPFVGDGFYSFLSKINQEVTFLVDEFEKVYSTDEQQSQFLPILDGAFNSKKLWIFTTNSVNLNNYLMNRPGRIKYHIKFDKISEATRDEVIEDLLENKEHKQSILDVLDVLGRVSIDVLINIIDEMNLYGEEAKEVLKFLNIRIEDTDFTVVAYVNGVRMTGTIRFNPLTVNYLYVNLTDEEGKSIWYDKEKEALTVSIEGEDFVFKDDSGNKLIFSRYSPWKFEL